MIIDITIGIFILCMLLVMGVVGLYIKSQKHLRILLLHKETLETLIKTTNKITKFDNKTLRLIKNIERELDKHTKELNAQQHFINILKGKGNGRK